MKNKIKLAIVAVIALNTTVLMATNGSNLIATGSKARAMGGTGIGVSHGAESALANVAMITSVKDTEVSFGGMFFMPDVSNNDKLDFTGNRQADLDGSSSSASDLNVIPEVSLAGKINDNFYMGIGIWGTAGMGVDYRGSDKTEQMEMVTNLQLMQFALPLAYTKNGFSIGITPLLQYGSLDINYVNLQNNDNVGSGLAQDLKFGLDLGVSYKAQNGITVGAVYKSQIDMFYKSVLTSAIDAMGVSSYNNDCLSTPAEIGIGISYELNNDTFAFDYKQIKWSDAKGYQDFDWDDQNVFAFGYEHRFEKFSFRLGYNYAKSPISEQKRTVNAEGQETNINDAGLSAGLVNTFNTLGFPGIVETHYTVGGYYQVNKQMGIATALVYAPEEKISYDNFSGQKSTTTHGQTSLSFDLVHRF